MFSKIIHQIATIDKDLRSILQERFHENFIKLLDQYDETVIAYDISIAMIDTQYNT